MIINSKTPARLDAQRYARLMFLQINYELDKHEVLPYLAKAVERYLIKNNESIPEFDKCILTYFERKLSKITNKKEEKEVFIKWKKELLRLPRLSVFYTETEDLIFDFVAWLESKIENRPMLEVLREKKKS